MSKPRQLDEDLIDAYRARRALDYLVGFTLSPVLWRKLPGAKSAGRVQSVSLRLIVDHCGIFSNSMRATIGGGAAALSADEQLALFDQVLALSEFPNIALKWGHASTMFDRPAWPGEGLWPILRRAVSAFGPERVMWASDYSVNQRGESWAELLFGIRGNPELTEVELQAVLGGSARALLGWQA